MASLAALILALCQAVPVAERLLGQVVALYVDWKKSANSADEIAKNARDRADIAAAGQRVRGQLCAACPLADLGGGQHAGPQAEPAVSRGGSSGPGLCIRHV